MKKVLKNALLVAFTAGLACAAGAVTKFEAAESVWPAGLAEEMNTLIAFRAPFELKAGERPVLKMVAWYSYRVTLNGAFVGFGPARGPKGFFRPTNGISPRPRSRGATSCASRWRGTTCRTST